MTDAKRNNPSLAPRSGASRGALRELVLGILARERGERAHATDLIAEAFRREKRLNSADRRFVAETVYGVLRSARLLDFALERACPKGLTGQRRDLGRYLARLVLDGIVAPSAAHDELPGVDFAALGEAVSSAQALADPIERLATVESLPDWLAVRLVADHGQAGAEALAHALNQRAPMCVRANRVLTTREALAVALAKEGVDTRPLALAPDGLEITERQNVFALAAFQSGLFEVQDEGSQLVSELVAPPPKGLVIDACAGAGGKTLHLAALLAGKGRVIAFDVPPQATRKLGELRRRARRAALTNVHAVEVPAEGGFPAEVLRLVGRADRVLVDAPCSGIGVLRRNPEARWRVTDEETRELAVLQRSLLERYACLVAPGGRLIYATCTVLALENDAVVAGFLAKHPEFSPMSAKEILGGPRAAALGDGQVLRVLPHSHGTDGFFAAVLRRTA